MALLDQRLGGASVDALEGPAGPVVDHGLEAVDEFFVGAFTGFEGEDEV